MANEAYVRCGYGSAPPEGGALIDMFPPGYADRGAPAPPDAAPPPPPRPAGHPPAAEASDLAWLQGGSGPVAGSSGDGPPRPTAFPPPPYPPPPGPTASGLPSRPSPTFPWLDEEVPGVSASGKLPHGFVWVAVETNPRAGVDVGDRVVVGVGEFFLLHVSVRRGILRSRLGYDFFAVIAEHSRLHEVHGGWRGYDDRVLPGSSYLPRPAREWLGGSASMQAVDLPGFALTPRSAAWCVEWLRRAGSPLIHHEN